MNWETLNTACSSMTEERFARTSTVKNTEKAPAKEAANPDKLELGPVVDDKLYEQFKPHLEKMWAEARDAFHDAMEALDFFYNRVLDSMGDDFAPYIKKFYREVKAGDKGLFSWNESEEARYQKAKPLFESGFKKFNEAGKTLKDYIVYMTQALKQLGWNMEAAPVHLKRFLSERENGDISNVATTVRQPSDETEDPLFRGTTP